MTRPPELAAYFEEAASWDADRAAQSRRSARVAWVVAGAGVACAVACSLALVMLLPLKSVEAFVVRVDSRSGIVDVVPSYQANAAIDETVTRYLLTHYVRTCERFSWPTAESDYAECAAFHGSQRNQAWAQAWSTTNPASPLNRYKDGTSVRVQVQSLTFFQRASGVADLAQVRYAKAERRANGAGEQLTYWIATLQYVYGAPARDPATRAWNPLGLRILDFHPEPETRESVERSDASASASPGETP